MVFGLNGETLHTRCGRKSFRNCPRFQNSVPFKTQIVMQSRRMMPVNDEGITFTPRGFCRRLRCFCKVSFLRILFKLFGCLIFFGRFGVFGFCRDAINRVSTLCMQFHSVRRNSFPCIAFRCKMFKCSLDIEFLRVFHIFELFPCQRH